MGQLLAVDALRVHFPVGGGLFRAARTLRAVDGVDLTIAPGETLALVGESGCGKTTLGRAVAGLYPATAGTIRFRGVDVTADAARARTDARRAIQTVFQDPFSALNPRMPVSAIVIEPLKIHRIGTRRERAARARELMEQVGLPADALNRYPHEFSGGQRQRIAIARALSPGPDLVIADEPLSALDVSIQSQILNLMKDLQAARLLSYLFISHDLAVVNHLADRVAVMYLGRLVELAPRDALFRTPSHPYTRALLDAIPRIGRGRMRRGRVLAGGDVPSPLAPPPGCRFHPRCPKAQPVCREVEPALEPAAGRPAQVAACHFKD
ncbi:MAG TPA: ABC transporter ATP-binding protein [Stellaceae bacterium]